MDYQEHEEGMSLKKPKVRTPGFDANSVNTATYHNYEPKEEEQNGDDVTVQFSFRKLYLYAGPGILMSIAYLDPGNIAGDLNAGIYGHYSLLWTLMWAIIIGYMF